MRKVLFFAFLAVLALVSCGAPSFRGSVLDEPVAVPDFSLTDEEGDTFHEQLIKEQTIRQQKDNKQ